MPQTVEALHRAERYADSLIGNVRPVTIVGFRTLLDDHRRHDETRGYLVISRVPLEFARTITLWRDDFSWYSGSLHQAAFVLDEGKRVSVWCADANTSEFVVARYFPGNEPGEGNPWLMTPQRTFHLYVNCVVTSR